MLVAINDAGVLMQDMRCSSGGDIRMVTRFDAIAGMVMQAECFKCHTADVVMMEVWLLCRCDESGVMAQFWACRCGIHQE